MSGGWVRYPSILCGCPPGYSCYGHDDGVEMCKGNLICLPYLIYVYLVDPTTTTIAPPQHDDFNATILIIIGVPVSFLNDIRQDYLFEDCLHDCWSSFVHTC